MNLSFQLGIAHEKASQGQNVTDYNTLVEVYNAWIQQHFGEDANLFMLKMNYTTPSTAPLETNDTAVSLETNYTAPSTVSLKTNDTTQSMETNYSATSTEPLETNDTAVSPETNYTAPSTASQGYKNPFKPGSDLSKFGKQRIVDPDQYNFGR